MQNRRYPGVSPFTSEQKNIFFGRDNDINKLYKQISMRNQILLYAKSGIGKTSLLNAGVLPKLENKYTIIKIRFFAYDNKNSISPIEKTLNALRNEIKHKKNTFLEDLISKTNYEKTLWYYFKQFQFAGKQKFILVFDQFEELFSYPQEHIRQFKNELHELTNIDIPNEIKQYIAENDDDNEQIDILYDDFEIKTVFAIRSDRLSLLNQLTDKIPDIQETFYELKPLNIEQTKAAIIQPAISNIDFDTKPFKFSDKAINQIVLALTDDNKQNIETTQLQIVCQKIEDIAQEKHKQTLEPNLPIITEKDLPEFKDIFLSFYDDTINSISKKNLEKNKIRKFIEDQLIRNNQRISLDEIICADYVSKEILQKLVNQHLLRAERNSTGGFSYELSHDTLIEPISLSRKQRIEREKTEIEEKKRQEQLQIANEKAEKERIEREKERKRQGRIIAIVSVTALISIAFAIFGFWQRNQAIKSQKETIKATIDGYYKDAQVLILDEEFDKAIYKYTYLRDTILKNDSTSITINKRINECARLDSLKSIFYTNLEISDSLLNFASGDKDFIKADSLINETKKLGYTYGDVKLEAIDDKKQIKIDNRIKQYISDLEGEQRWSEMYKMLYNTAIKLDSNNSMLEKFK